MTITPVTTSSQWRLIPKTSCTICIDRGNEEDFVEDHLEFETPTNYVGTLQYKVQKNGKLKGLKSYDYHILMHHALPLCIKKLMCKKGEDISYQLKSNVQKNCSKVIDPTIPCMC